MASRLDQLAYLPWPSTHDRVAPLLGVAPEQTALAALPFLVHEPSVVLWWLQQNGSREDVWVLEDDVAFTGDPQAFFDAYAEEVPSDLVSEFQPWHSDCLARLSSRLTAALNESKLPAWGVLKNVIGRGCEPPKGSPRTIGGGDSRALWPVHRWEHVERYSGRMLSALRFWLDRGVAAHGELFASSLCTALRGCTSFDLVRPD